MHVAEKGTALKGSNGLIATIENEDGDWQNGQNLLVVTQEPQSKEIISIADNQTINVAIDTYCSYFSRISSFGPFTAGRAQKERERMRERERASERERERERMKEKDACLVSWLIADQYRDIIDGRLARLRLRLFAMIRHTG